MLKTCGKLNCAQWVSGAALEITPEPHFTNPDQTKPEPRSFFWCDEHAEEIKQDLRRRGIEFNTVEEREAR